MNVSVEIISSTTLNILYRVESDGVVGDGLTKLKKGEDFLGIPFSVFLKNGDGSYETDDLKEVER